MIVTIARKEFTEMIRDGRYAWAAGIVFTLLVVSLLAGWRHYAEVSRQHAAAQAAQRQMWLAQGEKHPHAAAHYGVFAFKPRQPLSAVDRGLDPYLGVAQFLEAHRQHPTEYRPADDATPAQKFGELTAAATLQILLPLLIILLAYPSFAGEREQRTLRQLLSLGVARRRLACGKALGVAAPLFVLLVPAAAVGVTAMALFAGAGSVWLSLPRMTVMAAGYVAYFAVFVCLALAVSAKAASSRQALILLLGFWFLNSLVASRVASDLAKAMHPAPTAMEIEAAIETGYKQLPRWEERVAVVKQRLLAQHGVASEKDLPVLPGAVALYEEEQDDTRLYETHFNRLDEAYRKQERVYRMSAVAAPLLAVQSLSMGLAGADYAQHRHFTEATENYRRLLVNTLNQDIVDRGNTEQAWTYKAGTGLWERIPPFTYEAPGLGWVLRNHLPSVALLALWLVLSVVIALFAVVRVRVE
jgi:ABC-2 type transport system permease protein